MDTRKSEWGQKVDKRSRQTNEWCVSQIVRLQKPYALKNNKTSFYYFPNLSIFDRMTEQIPHSVHITWKSAKSDENKRRLHSNKIDKYVGWKQMLIAVLRTIKPTYSFNVNSNQIYLFPLDFFHNKLFAVQCACICTLQICSAIRCDFARDDTDT